MVKFLLIQIIVFLALFAVMAGVGLWAIVASPVRPQEQEKAMVRMRNERSRGK